MSHLIFVTTNGTHQPHITFPISNHAVMQAAGSVMHCHTECKNTRHENLPGYSISSLKSVMIFLSLSVGAILLIITPHYLCFRIHSKQRIVRTDHTHLSDFSTQVVSAIMQSPLYKPIVNIARKTMVKSATSVGVDWDGILLKMRSFSWQEMTEEIRLEKQALVAPKYYLKRFHGYEDGNLCIEAALEQELAGKAVGARNFPKEGFNGEEMLRGSYDKKLREMGAFVPSGSIIVDFGCGTGTSTRRLAKLFPQADKVIGLDLSPEMLAVGRFLLRNNNTVEWVDKIDSDDRIELQYADIAETAISSESVGLVSICLTLHELPRFATEMVILEAFRILEPGGVLSIMEMDPQAPGYVKLRASPWLFSILRSTEPYLDEYFELAPSLQNMLRQAGFAIVRTGAATGRHMAIVAIKPGSCDMRPSAQIRLSLDEHVATTVQAIQ